MKLACAVALVVLAAPVPAFAGTASIASRDFTPAGSRAVSSGRTVAPFDLVGIHWKGRGSVSFRTRSVSGRWSAWHAAAPEAEDAPDAASREARRDGWRIGNPYWTGPANRIEYRARGAVARVRAFFVRSRPVAVPVRRFAGAASPPIVPRLAWGANESIRRDAPRYAQALRFAVVHHTAGRNTYRPEESAAIVRAIQLYHVRGNGWDDIGYNFLVDKYGQVFEGRFGGMERNVVGAHAQGFNTGSVGVAVIGNYDAQDISPATEAALAELLSWRLDVAHVDPLSTLSWPSNGNSRFPRGIPAFLRAVSGHRDTGFTDCPGDVLYSQLAALAGAVAATGLPKLYSPSAQGAPGGRVRFSARLSATLPWTVTVVDASGRAVATGWGTGAAIDWTWDASGAPPGRYGYVIAAAGLRPAVGRLAPGKQPVLTITGARADPVAVTPDGDGRDDATTISYVLGAPARVTATLADSAGNTLATLFSDQRPPGPQRFSFSPDGVPDGTYTIVITAVAGTRRVSARVEVTVSRALSGFAVSPQVFSPNGDGRLDAVAFTFTLRTAARVRLRILERGRAVATAFSGQLTPGSQRLAWTRRLRDGRYEGEATATAATGTVSQRVRFGSDTTPPRLALASVRPLRVRVSEAAEIAVTADGRPVTVKAKRPGTYAVPVLAPPRSVSATALDAAGNASSPVRFP